MIPEVSILLAVYNDERFIEQSVMSVINQSYKSFELLIGFNGTTDESKNIVAQIEDTRIKCFDYGMDKGKSKTLNKLLKEAKGNWIAIQDGDDVWMGQKLEIQLTEGKDYDVIGTYCQYISVDGDFMGKPNLASSHIDIVNECKNGVNQIINASSLIKKEQILNVNGWDENSEVEDYDLWLKLINKNCKFINIPKSLVLHRLHSTSNFNTRTFDIQELLNKHKIC